jgi:3-deoxy-D-manno-octulosonic-acid transferase
MIRLIYNLLWPLGLVFFLPGYLVEMFRRGGYRRKFGQRLGIYCADVRRRRAQQKSTWLHAVSVGEVGVALKLAAELRRLQPDLHCVLTTTTTTGFSFAADNAPDWVEVMYNPLDFWPIMRCAFSVINPVRIVLIEAEIWPNLVAEAEARRVPIAVANARLSPRSEKRFSQFRAFVEPTFRRLGLVCVPEREDVDRWAALGIARERIHCTGSIKYDLTGFENRLEIQGKAIFQLGARDSNNLVLFGGSTHSGEEEILAQVFLHLRKQFPSLILFIAPRHVERVREIRRQLESLSLEVRLTSEVAAHPDSKSDCVLLDKTGELQSWYGVATVVFIGKSLTAHGGQNPVEAIFAGVPVVFGPHMENFAVLTKSLVARKGAIQVSERDQLQPALAHLLGDREARSRLIRNAEEVLTEHRGAAARTAQLISDLASTG